MNQSTKRRDTAFMYWSCLIEQARLLATPPPGPQVRIAIPLGIAMVMRDHGKVGVA